MVFHACWGNSLAPPYCLCNGGLAACRRDAPCIEGEAVKVCAAKQFQEMNGFRSALIYAHKKPRSSSQQYLGYVPLIHRRDLVAL